MVRPLKMAIFLLSVHTLLDQCLLNLHPTCITDFPTHLMHVPASDGFRLKSGFSTMIVKGAMRHVPTCWFPWSSMSQLDINSPKTGNILPLEGKNITKSCTRTTAHGGVWIQDHASDMCDPWCIKPLMNLSLTLGFFFDLKAGKGLPWWLRW